VTRGPADSSLDGAYRERIEDDRLEAVAAHVRAWLFTDKKTRTTKSRKRPK
jgi:hypothetical protein